MDAYLALLAEVDAWFAAVREGFLREVPCGRGCRDCCLGLFDISVADAALLQDGLRAVGPADRADIVRRAAEILAKLREARPDLKDDLDGWGEADIDALCDVLGQAECPALGREGECRLYDRRPLTCRLMGAPVVDLDGRVVFAEGCPRCTLRPEEAPRLDAVGLRRRERKLLKAPAPDRGGVTLLIPQALVNGSTRHP